jgi:hypothetical protein
LGSDAFPGTPWHKTLIYELHVKGFTARHPEVPRHLCGTYAGLTCPEIIDYFHSLGVTAIELLPVHQCVVEKHLLDKGLSNYWGYNSIGFFASDVRYASSGVQGQQVTEFKTMIKVLHNEGSGNFRRGAQPRRGSHGPTCLESTMRVLSLGMGIALLHGYTGCGKRSIATHPRLATDHG